MLQQSNQSEIQTPYQSSYSSSSFHNPNNQFQNPLFNQINTAPPAYQPYQQTLFQEPQFYQPPVQQFPPITKIFQISKDATYSLYVDGIPNDTTEREVAHVFRPFPGFQRVRLIKRQTQKGREYYLCFVDFEDNTSASIAMQTIQGYRFDKADKVGLKISFANNPKDVKQKK